jgi:hypothetical protein
MSEKTTPQTVASAVVLSTTLAARGGAIPVLNLAAVLLQIAYAVGTGGTGAEYDVELSGAVAEPSTDAQWWPAEALSDQSGTPSSGALVAPRSRVVHQLVTAEPRQAHVIDLRGARWLRVRAKETTATTISAAGTFTATAYGHGR